VTGRLFFHICLIPLATGPSLYSILEFLYQYFRFPPCLG